MNPPPGCPFQTRCPRKIGAICETELPPVQELGPGHKIMCHLPRAELLAMEPVIATGKKEKPVAKRVTVPPPKAVKKAKPRKK
jgi:peptide/nickel transport system ATP-binding protein